MAKYFQTIDKNGLSEFFLAEKKNDIHPSFFVMVAEKNLDSVEMIQQEAEAKEVTVIGAVFPELIVDGEFKKEGCYIVTATGLSAYFMEDGFDLTDDKELEDKTLAFAEDIKRIVPETDSRGSLMLVFDAMLLRVGTILDDFYLKLGNSLCYMGVNAGSETFAPMKCIFDNKRFLENAVLAMYFRHDGSVILEHGYTSLDDSIAATSTHLNCVTSIDWRPAFEVYSELAMRDYGVEITKENFYETAVHYPLGIVRADDTILVRIPVALTDEGHLYCVGEVPENSLLTLLRTTDESLSESVDSIAKAYKEKGWQKKLTFYCAGRRLHIGVDKAAEEMKKLGSDTDSSINGALSLGEISSYKSMEYPLFHNGAIVCLNWPTEDKA